PVRNLNSLPTYFKGTRNNFCPASYVGSFFSRCGKEFEGRPLGIALSDTVTEVDVGVVTINCSLKSNLQYNDVKINNGSPVVSLFEFDPFNPEVTSSFVGWF